MNVTPNHTEMVSCIICGDQISMGTVPAVCSARCLAKYDYLKDYNKSEEKEDKEDDHARTA